MAIKRVGGSKGEPLEDICWPDKSYVEFGDGESNEINKIVSRVTIMPHINGRAHDELKRRA